MTCSHCAGSIWCSGPAKLPTPAWLTRRSARPDVRSTSAASASTELRSVTTDSAISALPPDLRMASAVPSRGVRPRPQRKVRAPIRANRPAIAAPIPPPDPVTIATCPCRAFSVALAIRQQPPGGGFWSLFRAHANALTRILQDGETTRCKDKLALDETHTYNPPHRKRRLGVLQYWVGIFGARRNGQSKLCRDPRCLAWAISRRCRRFSRISKERFE